MDDLKAWLERHGLGQHLKLLIDHDVDLSVLPLLNDADLQQLGLSLGHRKRLLAAVAQGRFGTVSAAAPAAGASPWLAGERRHLTVLFCDMVGFTELANRVDPETLHGIVRCYEAECVRALARYAGHLFQLQGDGAVGFFGYPQAHEEDAERAIRAGLDMIDRFSRVDVPVAGRLQVRVGIASGLVVVLPDNGGAVGDTMNLAARLQSLADPGSVVVSDQVRARAPSVHFDSLGEHALKGVPQPVRVWRAAGLRQVDTRFAATRLARMLPLVGRRPEHAALRELLAQAHGGRGQVVVIGGEAGIGKSRLARAAIDEHRLAPGAWVAELQCSPFHVHSPLHPVAQHLRQRLLDGVAADGAARWAAIHEHLQSAALDPAEATPALAQLLGVEAPAGLPPSSLSPERARQQVRHTLLGLMRARCRGGAGLLLLEDLHWADPTTQDLVQHLVRQVHGLPLLVVLTHRPEFRPGFAGDAPVRLLPLDRLPPEESAELVRLACRDAPLPQELMHRVVEKTDGVPLFIEELSQAVVESSQAALAAAFAQVQIPASLRDSLFARLDMLGAAKRVAQLAAMLGRDFRADVLAAVWPGDRAALHDGLARLAQAGFIQHDDDADPPRGYAFKHALIQDAAYESLLKADRVTYHRRIATALHGQFPELVAEQPEVVAQHFAAGQVSDQAAALWLAAGALALRRNAHVEAVAHLRSALAALAELPDTPERALRELDVQLVLGTALVAAKGYASDEGKLTWRRAHALCAQVGQVPQRIPALFGLWMFHVVGAQHPEANALAAEIVQLANALGSDDLQIEGYLAHGISQFFRGRFGPALDDFAQVHRLYDAARHGGHRFQFGQDPLSIALLYEGWIHWLQGDFARALQAGDRGVAVAQELQHPFTLSFGLAFAAWQRIFCREHSASQAPLSRLLPLCQAEDIPVFMAHGLVIEGWLHCEADEPGCIGRLQAALDVFRATGSRCFLPHWTSFQAEQLAARGDLTQALALSDAALATVESSDERWAEPEVLRIRALLLQRQGAQPAEVEALLRRSIDVAARLGAAAWALRSALWLARHLVDQGRGAEAAPLLARALAALPGDPAAHGAMPSRDVAEAGELLSSLAPLTA